MRRQYIQHKNNAKRRGIPFLLTYEEWLGIWQASGQLHNRGKRKGQYVMGRPQDRGAYEVGNVIIIPCNQNTSDLPQDTRERMSRLALRRSLQVPGKERKQRMKELFAARDPAEVREVAARVAKQVWAALTPAQQQAKMQKVRDARWGKTS